jgi:hypothetical protein
VHERVERNAVTRDVEITATATDVDGHRLTASMTVAVVFDSYTGTYQGDY